MAMRSRVIWGLVAILFSSLSFSTPAPAAGAVTNPVIALSSNAKSVTVTPGKWSAGTKTTYAWLLDGKAVAGSRLSFTPTSKQKGKTLQYKEMSGKLQALSNTYTIGQVFLSGAISIAFTDETNSALTLKGFQLATTVPKTAVATVQWFRGAFEVKDATTANYPVSTGDEDSEISATITYTAKGFTPVTTSTNEISISLKPRSYSLMWADEFNQPAGSPVDPNIWVPQNGDGSAFGNRGWGNAERQWYTEKNSSIDASGSLVINATRAGANAFNCYYKAPCEWISSKFVTKDKVGFKYGRIEAKMKGSTGLGVWGAFWLLGANIDDRLWPWCGEIDVTELLGRSPNTNYGTLHGPLSGGGGRGGTTDIPGGFANDYHTYTIDWLPDQITWYLDGNRYASVNKTDKDWVFDHEFYLIMNLAMGGNFAGPVADDVTKATLSFDYIRMYSINGIGEVIKH